MNTLRALGHASPGWLLLAIAATLATSVLKGVRWWVFLRNRSAVRLAQVVRATLASHGLNNLLVANAGEIARVGIVVRGSTLTAAEAIGALAADKAVDVAAFLVLVAAAWSRIPASLDVSHFRWEIGVIVLIVAMAAAWRFLPRFVRDVHAHLNRVSAVVAFGMSIVAWALQVATYTLGATALGVAIGVAASMVAVVAVNLGFALRLTPGSIGVFQVIYVLAVSGEHVSRADALAVAILIQALQMVSSIAVASVVLPWTVSSKASP